jgi:hypothetical protein
MRIRTFIEGGRSLWTLHGMSNIVRGGGGRRLKSTVRETRASAGPMDFGKVSESRTRTLGSTTRSGPLDPDDDDPQIFVSSRSASSDK